MKEAESLCRVETKDGDLYLFTRWFGGDELTEFDITITDGSVVWKANATEEMIQDMASKVEMNMKEYMSQCFNALTASLCGKDSFIYEAIQNDSALEFNWKKQLDHGVKFQLGSLSLSLSQETKILLKKILDFSIQYVHEFKDQTSTMKCEMEQLARDRDNAILRLEKCITGKEEMEVDLFQKFVTVLNDKKAKIRRLQETIEQQAKAPVAISNTNTVPNTVDDHTTENDQTRDGDTDVEMEDSQVSKKSKNEIEETTATTSNIGSCLFQDEEDTAPVVKRRRKQPSRQPVRTPSKPVLPEVKTSIKRTTSNASSTSTNSVESKQSTGSTRRSRRNKASSTFPDDVEDLFGDMA